MSTLYSPEFLAAEAENFSLKFGCFVDVALLLASAAIIFLTGFYLVKTIYYTSRRPRNGAEKAKTIAWIGLFFETGLALLAKFFVIPFIYAFTNPTAPLEFKQLVADFIFFTNVLCNGILFFAATVIIYFAAKRLSPAFQITENQGINPVSEKHLEAESNHTDKLKNAIYSEHLVLERLKTWAAVPLKEAIDPAIIAADIAKLIDQKAIKPLAEGQKQAVIASYTNRLSLITGGPGTGKTEVLKTIALIDRKRFPRWTAAYTAPTGVAAKKLQGTIGFKTQTLHNLLKIRPNTNEHSPFAFDTNPLPVTRIVVDESSMLSSFLFWLLVRALSPEDYPGLRLVLVGDIDQLPPIGPGNPFKDLISSGQYTVTLLDKIHRQAKDSGIPVLAQSILEKRIPANLNNLPGVRFVDVGKDEKQVMSLLKTFVDPSIPQTDLPLILSPFREKTSLGVNNLNQNLQAHRHKTKEEAAYRVGDPVIQTVNLYYSENRFRPGQITFASGRKPADKEMIVSNGSKGWVVKASLTRIIVEFPDEPEPLTIVYNPSEQKAWLNLAYAQTVHKAQGSEAATVVLPVLSLKSGGDKGCVLWTQTKLYTAITRAKQNLVIIGDLDALQDAAGREESPRHTILGRKLQAWGEATTNTDASQVFTVK